MTIHMHKNRKWKPIRMVVTGNRKNEGVVSWWKEFLLSFNSMCLGSNVPIFQSIPWMRAQSHCRLPINMTCIGDSTINTRLKLFHLLMQLLVHPKGSLSPLQIGFLHSGFIYYYEHLKCCLIYNIANTEHSTSLTHYDIKAPLVPLIHSCKLQLTCVHSGIWLLRHPWILRTLEQDPTSYKNVIYSHMKNK